MRKLAFFVLAIVVGLGFYSCQQAESAGSKETAAEQVVDVNAQPATPAEKAPAVTRPEWQERADQMARTSVKFVKEEYNYGKVSTGEKVTYRFKFTNTGAEPLEITNVKPSCGCTTPSYSKEPIAPGEEGHIDVEFDTTGKRGTQRKTITVTANFDGQITRTLSINGEVLAEDS